MKDLTVIKDKEIKVCSSELARGFEIEHRALRQLIRSHEGKLKRYGKVTFQMQPSESGQKQSVTYLNEKQALLIMTYTRSNDSTDYYRMKLIDDFDRQREIIRKLSQPYKEYTDKDLVRRDGKVIYFQKTDTIKKFVDYATVQGSKSAKLYYMNLAKMENSALFFFEQKYPNLREVMDIRQLMRVGTADQLIEEVIISGMNDGLFYKEIYKNCKEKILKYADAVGKSPILALEDK